MIRMTEVVYSAGNFAMNLSLEIKAGEYVVIMGPTGAGKTAAVECLAGLRQPTSGRIEIAGRDVTRAEPRARSIGYVPQDYALFRHRTVWSNIAFGPEVHGWSRKEIREAVESAARLTGVESLLDRHVHGLSGGERQRTALARALAVKPKVLILDEPVSALDESTRETVCSDLRRLQRELGVTTIHISHNQEEAFTVADRAVIIRNGRLEQAGRMQELLRRPNNAFVARFMRCENFFTGEAIGPASYPDSTSVRTAGGSLEIPGLWTGTISFIVRPENIQLIKPGDPPPRKEALTFPVRIARDIDRGAYVRLELSAFQPLIANIPLPEFITLQTHGTAELRAWIAPTDIHVLNREGLDAKG